ncbi:MAG: M1 family peptidase, partial [Planctomycetota bacterium]
MLLAFAALLLAAPQDAAPAPPQPRRPLTADTLAQNGFDRDCDLLKIELDITIDHRDQSVTGTATSRIRAFLDGLDSIVVHSAMTEIEEVRDGRGRPLAWRAEDGERVRIELAEPLAAGGEEAVTIRYTSHPDHRGLYFVDGSRFDAAPGPQVWSQGEGQDNRCWIPMWDYPNDRAAYEARIRVFDGLTVVSNGRLIDVRDNGDGSATWHWRLDHPFVSYLISVAIGPWERYADDWRGIPVEYYVPRGCGEETARRSFGETPAMLEFFSNATGFEYPYAKYAQTAVAEFVVGGMENISATTQTDRTLHDERAELDRSSRGLVAHELAHQWFGDLVTTRGWSNLWLNEGFATYFQCLYDEHALGRDAFELDMERNRRAYVGRGDRARKPLVEDFRCRFGDGGANHVYVKGSSLLHMIRRELGDEGWWAAIRLYTRRHAWDLVDTTDFERAIFDATGRNLQFLFEQWAYCGGFPIYEVGQEYDAAAGLLRVRVRQTQTVDEAVPLFTMPLELAVWGEDGSVSRHRVVVAGAEQEIGLPCPGPPANLVFDAQAVVPKVLRHDKPEAWWIFQARNDDHVVNRLRGIEALAEAESAAARAALAAAATDPKEVADLRAQAAAELRGPRRDFDALMRASGDPD